MRQLLCLLFSCFSLVAVASEVHLVRPFAKSWDVEEGLVSDQVFYISEDRFGRAWLGTPSGVSIVDGLAVTNLKHDSNIPDTLRSDVILSIAPYQNDMLVLGLHGIDRVDVRSLKARSVNDPEQLLTRANRLVITSSDEALVVANRHLVYWRLSDDTLYHVQGALAPLQGSVLSIQPYDEQRMLLSTNQGLYIYAPVTQQLEAIPLNNFDELSKDIRAVFVDSVGGIWVSVFGEGVYRFNNGILTQHFNVEGQTLPSNLVSHMFERDGLVYVLTRRGLVLFDVVSLQPWRLVSPRSIDDHYAQAEMALTAMVNHKGNVWIGTTNGFYVIQQLANHVVRYSELLKTEQPLRLYDFIPRNNGFDVVSQLGRHRVTFAEPMTVEKVTTTQTPLTDYEADETPSLKLLEGNRVLDMHQGMEPVILQGFDTKAGEHLIAMFAIPNTNYYFLSSHSQTHLTRFESGQLTFLGSRKTEELVIADIEIYQDHVVIASQRTGVVHVALDDFANPEVDFEKMAGPEVPIQLLQDRYGSLWVLTLEGAIFMVNSIHKPLINWLSHSDTVTRFAPLCMTTDPQGRMWFSSKWGVSVWHQQQGLIQRYTASQGIEQTSFQRGGCGAVANYIYVYDKDDIYLFNTDMVRAQKVIPELGFAVLTSDHTSYPIGQVIEFVEPGLVNVGLYSSSLGLESNARVYYRLRSLGTASDTQEQWNMTRNNEIVLIKPTSGDYVLEAKLALNDGLESKPIALAFTVSVPFYRSTGMILLYALAVVAIISVFFISLLKLNRTKLKMSRLREEEQERYSQQLAQQVADKTAQYKEQQQIAVKANIDKTRFIASASHDIRAPLNAIRWQLERMQQTPTTVALMDELTHLDLLVESIVNLSKFDTNMIAPSLSVFSMQEVAEELLARFIASAKQNRVTLSTTVADDIFVQSDRFLLVRLLSNLIDNAIKNVPRGATVILSAQRDGARVRIAVEDNGQGIPECIKDRAFTSFVRGTGRYKGTGLGLTIVQQIATVLEFDVALETGEEGTTFTFYAPLASPPIRRPSTIAHQVLVIDDNPFYAHHAARLFGQLGYSVTTVESDFTQVLTHDLADFTVVLCDYHLAHDLDGISLMHQWCSATAEYNTTVLITSEDAAVRAKVASERDYVFIRKPIKLSQLSWLLQNEGVMAHDNR